MDRGRRPRLRHDAPDSGDRQSRIRRPHPARRRGSRLLGPHWPLQFALPANGAPGAEATTYFVDYQGVRFIILDGTAALDLGALESQTLWLDRVLAESPAQWNIAVFHQPIFTCARPNDTEALKAAWKPIFDARGIDLVLQGHDHCYGRVSDPDGATASRAASDAGRPQGPVYVVSVVGAKMYGLNDRADTQPVRAAENTELYQLIDVDTDRLLFRAFTATGRLYDAFTLVKGEDGRNRLIERAAGRPCRPAPLFGRTGARRPPLHGRDQGLSDPALDPVRGAAPGTRPGRRR